jgi:hypothetical protein
VHDGAVKLADPNKHGSRKDARDFPERFAATGLDLGKIPEVPNLAFGLVWSRALLRLACRVLSMEANAICDRLVPFSGLMTQDWQWHASKAWQYKCGRATL